MQKFLLTVEMNALVSLVLTLLLLSVIVWMNFTGVMQISSNADQLFHTNEIKGVIQTLNEHLVDVETGERGYIITGNEAYLEPYEHGLSVVNKYRVELARLLADEPSELGKLAVLNKRLDLKIKVSQSNVQARKRGFELARSQVMEGSGKREMDALQSILDEMTRTQSELQDGLHQQRIADMQVMKRNIIIAATVVIGLLFYLHLRLMRLMNLRHEAELNLNRLASHDVLTELPNRRLMMSHMELAIQRCLRNNKSMALLFLDLNGFKPVNDQYGHKVGDEVLKQVAQRLSGAMRASDRVARFGGDEFVVLAEDVTDKEDVCSIVAKITAEINRHFLLDEGIAVTISASIGVAIYPRDGQDLDTLLLNADTAMYAAKKSGSICQCKEQRQLRRCVLLSDGEK